MIFIKTEDLTWRFLYCPLDGTQIKYTPEELLENFSDILRWVGNNPILIEEAVDRLFNTSKL